MTTLALYHTATSTPMEGRGQQLSQFSPGGSGRSPCQDCSAVTQDRVTLTSVPLFISVLVMVSYLLYTSVNLSAFADTDRLRQQVTSQYVVVCSSQDLVSSLSLNLHGCHANSGLLTD